MGFIRNLVQQNRINISGTGHRVDISDDAYKALKKCRISISGKNNTLIIEKGARVNRAAIRIKGFNSTIHIGKNVFIRKGKFHTVVGENCQITVGDGSSIEGAYLLCDSDKKIIIGQDCMLSTGIMIRTGDKHPIYALDTKKQINAPQDILMENHVWIARDVTILKGAYIKSGSLVGAHSLVTKVDHEKNSILAGVPAKVVKSGIRWER